MSATIIVEDGTALTTANSYVSLANAELYFETSDRAAGWTALTTDQKNRLLITSARIIDSCFTFNGFKVNSEQAMQWPRFEARDPDQYGGAFFRQAGTSLSQGYFASDSVPKGIVDAQCEFCRFLISDDRTADAPGVGLRSFELTGTMKAEFDSRNLRAVMPDFVVNMLSRFGSFISKGSGSVKLVRA